VLEELHDLLELVLGLLWPATSSNVVFTSDSMYSFARLLLNAITFPFAPLVWRQSMTVNPMKMIHGSSCRTIWSIEMPRSVPVTCTLCCFSVSMSVSSS
jgi:hypothetical protein